MFNSIKKRFKTIEENQRKDNWDIYTSYKKVTNMP